MDNLLLRKAVPEDAAMIADLSQQLGYQQSVSQTEETLRLLQDSPHDAVLTAVHSGQVLGWLHVFRTLRLESGVFAEIGGMVVDAAYRGRGIGLQLVQEAINWCRAEEIPLLKVRSNTKRTDTHRFYRQAGFSEVKEQKVFELELGRQEIAQGPGTTK